ncbi:protein-L-isoaspartate(D-aspartate) O-methyltransferase [Candidatus Parcubacteria bacterium]|jgi:protein-L-isoaspartate(D-aspartate) O-methyltransferase|nr:MAG: protein-L-isoaspartate(D-aspartate) O-methyltransferase [Candidatus Parcubacteria bacterium]
MQEAFVKELIGKGVLYSENIIKAFQKVRRIDFVHEDFHTQAYEDAPLPIGKGQSISQPSTVAQMLELLQVEPGNRVLDVGCGSGWLTGLLAEIVGPSGFVYAVDIIPELTELTKHHLYSYHFTNIETRIGNGWLGLPEHAPYDRIVVSAAASEVPKPLIDQLAHGGRLIMPVGEDIQDLVLLSKDLQGKLEKQVQPGFQFVPLVGQPKK